MYPFFASGSLSRRYATPSPVTLRRLRVRAKSYRSIPRFVIRTFRVPIAVATIGVGGYFFASYKFGRKFQIQGLGMVLIRGTQSSADGAWGG